MRKITGMVLCAMLMLYSAVVIPVSAESENIFLNKNVTSSINASNAVLSIDKMVDGDRNTRFATPGNQTVPLEITIDLGGMYDVSKVVVTERLDKGFTCCDNLKIEVGTKNKWASLWTTAVEGESLNDAGTVAGQEFKIANSFEFDAICGNVVRLTLARSDRTPVQYQLNELIILGSEATGIHYEIGETYLTREGERIDELTAGDAAVNVSFP